MQEYDSKAQNVPTLADGTYTFPGGWPNAPHVAIIHAGKLVSLTRNGFTVELANAERALVQAEIEMHSAQMHGEEVTYTPPVIGKSRAARLHKPLARVGVAQHYDFAADSLGKPCRSLAALTELEARLVWLNVCRWFPSARSFKGAAA